MHRIGWKHPIIADCDLPICPRTDLHLPRAVAAVDLSGVPPVRVEVAERGGRAEPWFTWRLVANGPTDLHAVVDPLIRRPFVVWRQRNFELVSRLRGPMAEPIMRFELDPGGGQQIEAGRRNKFVARQQFLRDHARTGFERVVQAVRYAF